jgi:hypothetical protein
MSIRSRAPGISFALAGAVLTASVVLATPAPEPAESAFRKMLAAIQSNGYDDFVAQGDANFRAGMTKQMLEGVSQQLGGRLKHGYQADFLTSLRQQGYVVYVWKLGFKDGKDDHLVKMAMKDGKVGGFWVQ